MELLHRSSSAPVLTTTGRPRAVLRLLGLSKPPLPSDLHSSNKEAINNLPIQSATESKGLLPETASPSHPAAGSPCLWRHQLDPAHELGGGQHRVLQQVGLNTTLNGQDGTIGATDPGTATPRSLSAPNSKLLHHHHHCSPPSCDSGCSGSGAGLGSLRVAAQAQAPPSTALSAPHLLPQVGAITQLWASEGGSSSSSGRCEAMTGVERPSAADHLIAATVTTAEAGAMAMAADSDSRGQAAGAAAAAATEAAEAAGAEAASSTPRSQAGGPSAKHPRRSLNPHAGGSPASTRGRCGPPDWGVLPGLTSPPGCPLLPAPTPPQASGPPGAITTMMLVDREELPRPPPPLLHQHHQQQQPLVPQGRCHSMRALLTPRRRRSSFSDSDRDSDSDCERGGVSRAGGLPRGGASGGGGGSGSGAARPVARLAGASWCGAGGSVQLPVAGAAAAAWPPEDAAGAASTVARRAGPVATSPRTPPARRDSAVCLLVAESLSTGLSLGSAAEVSRRDSGGGWSGTGEAPGSPPSGRARLARQRSVGLTRKRVLA